MWHVGLNWLFDLGYVGTRGGDLVSSMNLNQARPGPGPLASRLPISPNISLLWYIAPLASSYYNSLQFGVQKRMSSGLEFLAAYTYSKTLDSLASTGTFGSSVQGSWPQSIYNLGAEYGVASFDQQRGFSFSCIYELPIGNGRRLLSSLSRPANAILGGWQLNGIVSHYSGTFFTPQTASNHSNSSGSATFRPGRLCNGGLSSSRRSINEWFNPA